MPLKYKLLIWIAVIVSVTSLSLVTLSLVAKAAITNSSRVIPYQGRLTDSGGNNVADNTYAMTFKIYTVSTGGSASFTEAHSSVTVTSGLFSVLLGSLSANGVNLDFANPPYYLGITIAANSEMSPRIQLGFVPLAHNAQYLDGTPLSSLQGQVPTGTIVPYAGSSAPTGFLIADGTAVSRTTYSALFAITSTTYGVGDGSTTFNLPDLRGRSPIGDDNMGGSAASRVTTAGSSIDGATLGASGGAQNVTLTTAQMPAHTHSGSADWGAGNGSYIAAANNPNTSYTTGSTGGGAAHNNMPPSLVLSYIIKY